MSDEPSEHDPQIMADLSLVALTRAIDMLESVPAFADAVELEIAKSRLNSLLADVWHHRQTALRHAEQMARLQ